MSDKKKSKRRKDEYTGPGGSENPADETPPKDEFKVAKWLKKNVPTKKTKFLNHNVEYFTAYKALDALMESAFAQGDNALFNTRETAIEYLDSMLVHKFFHRAKKVLVSEAELRRGKKAKEDKPSNADEEQTLKKRTTKSSTAKASSEKEGSEVDVKKSPKPSAGDKTETTEKKKRKIRLDMHPDQVFVDGAEPYVWIYDPIPVYYWLFGALLVVGAIIVCLFPLWPPTLRKGVYYLSIAAAGFLVFILSLAIIRLIVFCIVWVLTGSKHHFWLFPNLTEDVGFFASFWPLYQHDYIDGTKPKDKKSKKAKKDKNSDVEEEVTAPLVEPVAAKSTSGSGVEELDVGNDQSEVPSDFVRRHSSDSESECSQKSSTGKDFEMVNPEEVAESS